MQRSFIEFIKQLPFLRIIIPFVLGIIFQINFETDLTLLFVLILIPIIFILVAKIYKKGRYFIRHIFGISITIVFFVFGAILLKVNTAKQFLHINDEIIAEAILSEPPTQKENSFKTFAKIKRYKYKDSIYNVNNKIVIYFEKDSSVSKLKYGDKVIFKSRINEIKTAGNPYEFDYRKFLFYKGIIGQTYIKATNWKKLSSNNAWQIFSFAYNARVFLANIYKSQNVEGQEFAVLQALTLGDKSEIDKNTRKAYVASGAMHILAVSGLHVGIIYFILNIILGFLDKIKYKDKNYGSWIKAVIIIIILWTFALISGLSPSVRRAALMFMIVIIGRTMKNSVSIYNSISASAFILLLIDPYQITNVGFQLSYAAVISIIYFQPKIVQFFVIKNKILFYFWSLSAVSIAAQIGTAPISLYYFHIFPNYFILANIIVIPAALAIVSGAVALLISSAIPYVSTLFATILIWLIKLLNFCINFIEGLPFSSTKDISFNNYDVLFLVIIIFLFASFIAYKRPKSLINTLIILLIWLSVNTFIKISVNYHKQFFVYNIKGKTAINIIGNENILIADSLFFYDESIRFGPYSNWLHLNKTKATFINIQNKTEKIFKGKHGTYFKINSHKTLIINNKTNLNFNTKNKLNLNFIIISGNPNITISEVLKLYNTKLIIFDASNNFYKIKDWKHECKILNQEFYVTSDKGAFKCYL